MRDQLLTLKNQALAEIVNSSTPEEWEQIRIKYLGKNGLFYELTSTFANLPLEQKKDLGQLVREVKATIESALKPKIGHSQLAISNLDYTLPGTPQNIGLLHPISAVAREMNSIFQSLGFSVADGPELENDDYNYNRLNLPPDHPARDLQDSLYIREPDLLLRTHTSSIESHILATHKPPYRFVFPGKAYRYENVSATNHMQFFQYQGVAVGENITLANLKWTLDTFVKQFFGSERKTRFRCKYYPEVEPGVGMDIDCPFCNQAGCTVCKYRGWIEMLGAGMIHPNMFRRVGVNPTKWSGFAWGMGLDRITMSRYGLNDIRALFNGDLVYKL